MTDKQIIIDGVDVSGCRCLAYPEADNPMCTGLYLGCKNNNCEYKNWKRKEQECEELRTHIVSFDYLEALSNEQVASLYTATIDELAIRGFKAKYNTEASLLTQYQQVLTEIKQLLEDALDTDKTNAEQSFDCLYKAIEKCEVLDETSKT